MFIVFHHFIETSPAVAPISLRWPTALRRYLHRPVDARLFHPQLKLVGTVQPARRFFYQPGMLPQYWRLTIDLRHPSDIRWHDLTVGAAALNRVHARQTNVLLDNFPIQAG